MKSFKNSVLYLLLALIPKNCVSNCMGILVSIRLPKVLAKIVNKIFARAFRINVDEAKQPIEDFACLQDFFVRELKDGIRPLPHMDNVLCSPCDGTLSTSGIITGQQLIQAKGQNYSVADFLQDKERALQFENGMFATIYLSPRDYHRFHVPIDGEIIQTTYVKGSLWPVNNWAVNNVPRLFCQNERVITLIKSHTTGRILAHVAVGATMVGKIQLEYLNIYEKHFLGPKFVHDHAKGARVVKKGLPLGQFMFGSTIVLLMEPGLLKKFSKRSPSSIKVNEMLGELN